MDSIVSERFSPQWLKFGVGVLTGIVGALATRAWWWSRPMRDRKTCPGIQDADELFDTGLPTPRVRDPFYVDQRERSSPVPDVEGKMAEVFKLARETTDQSDRIALAMSHVWDVTQKGAFRDKMWLGYIHVQLGRYQLNDAEWEALCSKLRACGAQQAHRAPPPGRPNVLAISWSDRPIENHEGL